MSIDLVLQASIAADGGIPNIALAKDSKFKLLSSLVFLDGKKLGPLRALSQATFDQLDAHLTWSSGLAVVIRFPEFQKKALETLKTATESALKRASQSPLHAKPACAIQLASSDSITATPQRHDEHRRPVPEQCGSGLKRRAQVALTKHQHDSKAAVQKEEDDDVPIAPLVDATLTEDDRQKRRRLAAELAEQRAAQIQTRGIGDASCATRMQERAEREELIGRIKERYAMQRSELPWNLGGFPLAELRAHFKLLSQGKS